LNHRQTNSYLQMRAKKPLSSISMPTLNWSISTSHTMSPFLIKSPSSFRQVVTWPVLVLCPMSGKISLKCGGSGLSLLLLLLLLLLPSPPAVVDKGRRSGVILRSMWQEGSMEGWWDGAVVPAAEARTRKVRCCWWGCKCLAAVARTQLAMAGEAKRRRVTAWRTILLRVLDQAWTRDEVGKLRSIKRAVCCVFVRSKGEPAASTASF
jgi:hypothetical protein